MATEGMTEGDAGASGLGTELSPDAERMMGFVRANGPAGPIGTAIVVTIWAFAPSSLAIFLTLTCCCLANWWLVARARRLIIANELRNALFCICSGMWILAVAIGFVVPLMFAMTAIIAVLPIALSVALAGSHIGRDVLLRIIIFSTAAAAFAAVMALFPPLYPLPPELIFPVRIINNVMVPILIASAGLALWNESQRLVELITNTQAANEALAESERTLEHKVDERTAELESKNVALHDSQEDLANARDAAIEASRSKSDFLANMSHELRTPLNAIIGYSEMLQEDAEDAGQAELVPDLEKIQSSGRYLLTLINGVLDLSKIEAGKMDVFCETFAVSDLIEGVVATIQPLIQKNGNTLEVGNLDGLGTMHSDITKMRQALFNLLSNASKFTQQGRVQLTVERATRDEADWLGFRVSDSGIGMTDEQLGRIFEAFSQADTSTTREYGGTGLGLAITKEFCTMLGGQIAVESEVGSGSVFKVEVPALAPQPAAATTDESTDEDRSAPDSPTGERTVLVVDDDNAARDLIVRHLERDGLTVTTAASGREALEIARANPPDVITLDVVMPGMDGWDVLRELKSDAALSDVPVILVTMLEDQEMGYALGAVEYLTKPVDWEQLSRVLERHAEVSAASILIVDDDAIARDILRRGAERIGCEVVEATNGREAIEAVTRAIPDLILLDLMMPVMDGFEVVAELRRNTAWMNIPVVVVTAKELTERDRAALSGGVARILEKGSFERADLLDEVRRLIGERTGVET